MLSPNTIVFGTPFYTYLRDEICHLTGFHPGEIVRAVFPDGEHYQRLDDSVMDRDVVFVGGTISDEETLSMYDAACAMAKYGARTLTLVIPFFGHSTMERAIQPGEVVTAKTRARLFSAIPQAANGNSIVLIDLHVEGMAHYFEGPVRTYHLYAKPLIIQAINELAPDGCILGCTDAGRAKWVESLANDVGIHAAFVLKRRLDATRTEVIAVSDYVKGHPIVIYDDMIRTGGSLINAAKAYREAGATKVSAIATHGLFPGDSLARLEKSGLFQQIICTNTHARMNELSSPILQTVSVGKLLADFLRSK